MSFLGKYSRKHAQEKIFFVDDGYVCLDWINKFETKKRRKFTSNTCNSRICLKQSQCLKIMTEMPLEKGYIFLYLNSWVFNSEMTSSFSWHWTALPLTIKYFTAYRYIFPLCLPLYLVDMSLGGSYLLQILLQKRLNRLIYINFLSKSIAFAFWYGLHDFEQ